MNQSQLETLDPTGERKALFDYRRNPRSVKVGDIVRVTFKNGDPFAGVCLSIRLRGHDTSFLLRNQLSRVGVEMWVKALSPNVESVEIVQRTAHRKRRARLYYMRCVSADFTIPDGTGTVGFCRLTDLCFCLPDNLDMTWAPLRTSSRTISDRSKAFGASRDVGDVDRDGELGLPCKPTLAFGDCIITCTCILNLMSRCLSGNFGYKAIESIFLNGRTMLVSTRACLTLIHPLSFVKGLALVYINTWSAWGARPQSLVTTTLL